MMYKKIIVSLVLVSLIATSCRKTDTVTDTPEVSIETQNSYDDQAAIKFLNDNYLDNQGNITAFSDTDTTDDNKPKLSTYNPVTLSSGVIYIVIPNAQPTANPILTNDILHLMSKSTTYVATSSDNVVNFGSAYPFRNTIQGTGTPEVDPAYYYVKQTVLDAYNTANNTTYTRSFYEIEGFREAIQKFQAFNMADSDGYNLQGIIIVPSRVAFARDPHYNYTGISLNNRSFVFNFQVYKRLPRN